MIRGHDAGRDDRLADTELDDTLTRIGGVRDEAPPEREARVKRVFIDECRAAARARASRRRKLVSAGLLAAAATAAVFVRFATVPEPAPARATVVAKVERVDGAGVLRSVDDGSATRIRGTDVVRVGDWIETGVADRIGVRLSQGASVRFDVASRARFLSAEALELVTGAVYIDSERESPSLEVQTTFAAVRDVGTQFEVRVGTSALRVRVRSGVVEVRRGAVLSSARPGTELTVDSRGVISRAFAPYGPEWAWAAGIGPGFAIEGRPLSGFLDHLCREHGWTLAYADAALAHAASRIILHGSIEGLQPSDALDMVLATSGLTRQWNDGELLVTRNAQR